jgi:hypothetical protein
MEDRVAYSMDTDYSIVGFKTSSEAVCSHADGGRFSCNVKVYDGSTGQLDCEGNVLARKGHGKGAIFDDYDQSLNCLAP